MQRQSLTFIVSIATLMLSQAIAMQTVVGAQPFGALLLLYLVRALQLLALFGYERPSYPGLELLRNLGFGELRLEEQHYCAGLIGPAFGALRNQHHLN